MIGRILTAQTSRRSP